MAQTSQSQSPPPSSSPTIKTRILIISDTHSSLPYPPSANVSVSPFRSPLPRADVVLHCGDLTMVGKLHEYERALQLLSDIDAELKLVIAGNHDISLDERYYALKGQYMQRLKEPDNELVDKAKELWTGERARSAGVRYLEEGTYSIGLKNGARLRVYASPYQPEFCDWAFPYWRNQDRFNSPEDSTPGSVCIATNPIPTYPSIDILMTHGPPTGIRDETTTGEHAGCEHLLRAAHRARPLLHCFGHIHEGWGAERVHWAPYPLPSTSTSPPSNTNPLHPSQIPALDSNSNPINSTTDSSSRITERGWINPSASDLERERGAFVDISSTGPRPLERGRETLMVNASIMSSRYRAVQGAWVVDLDLERGVDGEGEGDVDMDRD